MTDKKLEEAAEYYATRDKPHHGVIGAEIDAFIAGAQFERKRILELLRSEDANKFQQSKFSVVLPSEWADWIEAQFSARTSHAGDKTGPKS